MEITKAILYIIDKKGPITVSQICEELNDMLPNSKPFNSSEVISVLQDMKELLKEENDCFSIHQDWEPKLLKINISGYPGPCINVTVDFNKNRFTFFEWNYEVKKVNPNKKSFTPFVAGNVHDFKMQLYELAIWDWEPDYQVEGIVLDGICWSVRLETTKRVFEKEGLEAFPQNWDQFCEVLSSLIGKPILEMLPR